MEEAEKQDVEHGGLGVVVDAEGLDPASGRIQTWGIRILDEV